MTFYKARQAFDDAKNFINPQKDPIMWDLIAGLRELTSAIEELDAKVSEIDRHVKRIRT